MPLAALLPLLLLVKLVKVRYLASLLAVRSSTLGAQVRWRLLVATSFRPNRWLGFLAFLINLLRI